jgi:transposase
MVLTMEKSRTQQALDLLQASPGMSIYRAAKLAGVSAQTVGAALQRIRRKAEKQALLEQGGYVESH